MRRRIRGQSFGSRSRRVLVDQAIRSTSAYVLLYDRPMAIFKRRALDPVDRKAAEAFKRGDTIHMRKVYVRPTGAPETVAKLAMRVEAAGWKLTHQQFNQKDSRTKGLTDQWVDLTFERVPIPLPQ